ncbi:transmembrane protein, putative (macronuclear) [Tetrahymena thermophila SB210]|uniref:Transmembrane protein, putative n=1 Tax=Tetrahymena thermophila (strain SB210) TaxID=312017 RepID=I7MA85_TETTS|nr:transmembrane protein, putative [Tetrahymena thermophila SB210]EAS03905.1 transmembrane protein, putative [Tetrahymena thermophila SB210]|eukprot:XP_001024150.1 transmembrane protein, putative [Tetrahymena thermophila SB210]
MIANNLMLIIYVLVELHKFIVLASPQNCLTLNTVDQTKCDVCLNGFFPQQDQTGCSNTISQCVLYSGSNCIQCQADYGVFNQICVNNIPFCAFYLSLSKCQQCHTDQGYSMNTTGTTCYNTIPNCQLYSSSSICKQCNSGYSLASDFSACYLAPVKNCFQVSNNDKYTCGLCDSSFYLTTQKSCQQCSVPYCSVCNADGTCSQCINNAYTLSNGVCVCNQGFYKQQDFTAQNSLFTCQACSYKCASCFEYDVCTSCSANRTLDKNCECPSNQITDLASNDCISCKLGQYKIGNQCVTSCPKGYYNNQYLGECTICSSKSSNQQCSNLVLASLKYNEQSQALILFSETVNLAQNIQQVDSCFNIQLINQHENLAQLQVSFTQLDGQTFRVSFQQNQFYTETKVVIQSIFQNCFQTSDGKLIDYQINLNPDSIILSPEENFLSSPSTFNKGMKITIYILGAFILFCSFFGIKISSTITIEAIQVVFCLYFVDLYIPFHLQSLFQAIDIFNFRILNYIMSGFDGLDLKRDDLIFQYSIKDQVLSGRFFQRGFQVCSFFYNGLTYLFLIILFYGIYLFLTNTFLAPYDYPLAQNNKEDSNKKSIQLQKDKSNVEDKSQLKPLELNLKSPKENNFLNSDSFQLKQNGQKENDKLFDVNKYEKVNFYLLQISLNTIKISYVPLSFAAGLQLKNYSSADQINQFSFFCAMLTLLLIAYTFGVLMYRDIKKYAQNMYERKQDQKEYTYQVSELNIRSAVQRKNKMDQLKLIYPILQVFSYSIITLLITWLQDIADILLYILISTIMLLIVVNMYSPFTSFKANLIHFISNFFILIILVGQLIMRNLYNQIENSSIISTKTDYFNSIQYVAIFLSSTILLFTLISSLFQANNTYQYFKNGFSVDNVAVVHPIPITSPTKNAIMTFENIDEKNQLKSPKQDIPKVPIKENISRKTSFLEIKKDQTNQLRRQSTLSQMQTYEQSTQQKQIFVAPRKSLQVLKQSDFNSQTASQSSFNDQFSTNPSSIQVIELEDIQKLVRENKKMEQKLAQIEKKQQQLIKKMNYSSAKHSLQNSFQSLDQDVKSDEEEPRIKKRSQNQSIETIEEEEELSQKNGNRGERRKRQSQVLQQIPQTPPSLKRIQHMQTNVFHFGDDIKLDSKKDEKIQVKEERQPIIKQNKFDKKKSKTMILEDDKKQIFNYGSKIENSNQKMLIKSDSPNKQISEKSSSSSSNEEGDEDDLNFWKNTRKEQLRVNKQSRAQSLLFIKNE